MDYIIDQFNQWIKDFLIACITNNLSGLFDTVNTKVGEIAVEVGKTPSGWNGGVLSMIHSVSDTVIIPIAGMILAFVLTYELIQMLIDRNNLHEVDSWIFFKWIFKSFVAIYLVTHTFEMVMAVFDVAQHVVSGSQGVISSQTSIDIASAISDLETTLQGIVRTLYGDASHSIYDEHYELVRFYHHLRPYDRDLFILLSRSYSSCHHGEQGLGTNGTKLSSCLIRTWFSRIPHSDLCRNLCGNGKSDYDIGGYSCCGMGGSRLHGAFMFQSV